MRVKRSLVTAFAVMSAICFCSCFPKGYTNDEQKAQVKQAIKIAGDYQKKYAPNGRLKENTFHAYDVMREGEHELKLTDWVYGEYLDGGKYNMYVNTATGEVYSDKEWDAVKSFGSKQAEKLYGLDEDEMTVDVWFSTKLPFVKGDDAFGMLSLSNMLPATDKVDDDYIRALLENDDYSFTYHICVGKDADMEMFRTLDTKPLGKNAGISVRQFSDKAFSDIKNNPDKRIVYDGEGVLDEYRSDSEEDRQNDTDDASAFDGKWYAQDDSGAVLTIDKDRIRFESGDIRDEASLKSRTEDDRIVLETESAGDIPFLFYEINYYPDDERIDAFTWPEDDGDGGYKRTVFGRDEYVPGDEKMLELLYGDWEIMDDGELIQEPGIKRDRLRFALPQYHRVRFITASGDMETFNIELSDMFDEPGNTYDRLTLSNRAGSGKYDWDEVRPGQSFQIMIANNLGSDYMMLRELGDERTGFATDGLKYDRSILGTWMLRRPNPDEYDNEIDSIQTTPSTFGIEDSIRQKDTSFYAFKWMEFGNSCTLQRVEMTSESEYVLPKDEYAYSAVNYEYKGKENMAHGGYFDPALVHVTTDSKGQITDIEKVN